MAVEVCGAHGWPRNRRWLGMVGECWAEGVVMNGGGGVWSARMAAQPVSPSIDIRRRPAYSLRGLRSCARYTEVAQLIGVPMPRPVVAAAIVDSLSEPTMLLACSRAYPQELRGQFELPGGKVEDAEDPAEALAREIAEELGARLTIGERVCPEGGQVRVRLGDDAVCVDDDRASVGVRAEDVGGVDVAGGVDLRLLLPDHAADGCDDREDDDCDGGNDDDAGAAVSALLRLAHLGGFRAHGIDGRLLLLSHGLTFRK